MKKIILMVFTLILALTGCSSKTDSKPNQINTKQEDSNKTKLLYNVSLGMKDHHKGDFNLLDLHDFTFEVQCKGNHLDYGILVFMDGYLQKYKIEDEIKDMNVLSLKDKETKDFKIQIPEFKINKGSEHSIEFAGVLNPIPVDKLKEYKVNHSILPTSIMKVVSKDDDKYTAIEDKAMENIKKTQVTEADLKEMNIKSLDDMGPRMQISLFQNGKKIQNYINPDQKVEIKATGGYGEYNMYLFVDGHPYDSDNCYYSFETTKGYFSSMTIDLPKQIKKYKNFFVVFAPKNTKNITNSAEQSDKLMIGSNPNA